MRGFYLPGPVRPLTHVYTKLPKFGVRARARGNRGGTALPVSRRVAR